MRLVRLLVVLTVVGWPLAGHAHDPPCPPAAGGEAPEVERDVPDEGAEAPPSENEQRARRLFLLGDDLYMQGRYEEALVAFEESYELSGRPLLLYNMANVHERAGDFDEALLKLEAYLPHSTDDERARLRTRIESLRDRIARIEERRRQEEEQLRRAERLGRAEGEGEPVRVPALLTTLGGVALLGGGVALAFVARGARDDLDELCADVEGRTFCPVEAEGAAKRDRRASAAADGLFVGAAAAVAVGIWLFVRDEPAEDEEPGETAPEVDAWLGPGGAGVQVRGAF